MFTSVQRSADKVAGKCRRYQAVKARWPFRNKANKNKQTWEQNHTHKNNHDQRQEKTYKKQENFCYQWVTSKEKITQQRRLVPSYVNSSQEKFSNIIPPPLEKKYEDYNKSKKTSCGLSLWLLHYKAIT